MNTKKLTAEEAQEAVAHDPENLVAKDKEGNVWAWNPDFNVIGFPGYGLEELGAERWDPFTIHRLVPVGEEHAEVLLVLDEVEKWLESNDGAYKYRIQLPILPAIVGAFIDPDEVHEKIAELRQRYEGGEG